jgi:hypothetical protein
MRPPRSTRCPRCGFSFAWNGRRCGHCPTPSRARQLWEQIGRFPELVGSNKGITQRQLHAITIACLRRICELLPASARPALEQLERDPAAFAHQWGGTEVSTANTWEPLLLFETALRLVASAIAARGVLDTATVQSAARELTFAAGGHAMTLKGPRKKRDDSVKRRNKAMQREEAVQCEIARDVLGYPEFTVKFDRNWGTTTAVAIVREMYSSRDFSAMPILADALQDAGCDEPEILEHCRAEKPHVRGCWVCEEIVGKVPQSVA